MSLSSDKTIDLGLKIFFSGTHRVVAPSTTLDTVNSLLPVLGITRVANITGLDRIGIPVSMVCRPNARSVSVSQGKGLDLASAKASGVMESIESYHAEHIHLPLKLGSYEELRQTHSIPNPHSLPRTKEGRWHPNLQLLWIEGIDWASRCSMWVPFESVHLNATLSEMPGEGCFFASSSGLASGNHPLEAVSHGICELVERDALALWKLRNPDTLARLDLYSVDDPECIWLLQRFHSAGIAVAVWNVTSDVGITVFLCCALDMDADCFYPIPIAVGSGCHPSRAVALSRALTEAAQCRATLIAGSRDDLSFQEYEYLLSREAVEPWRNLLEGKTKVKFRDTPDFLGSRLSEDVSWELEQLHRVGLKQVIVVDLTRPEFRIPVVRVVIPGLEPDDPGRSFGPRSKKILYGRFNS